MYAASSNILDVIVMNETVGIYFRFPRDPSRIYDPYEYLWQTTKLGTDFGDEPWLSLSELFVFCLLGALERNDVPLRDFAAEALSAIPVTAIRQYRNILPGPEPGSKKDPNLPISRTGRTPSAANKTIRNHKRHFTGGSSIRNHV